MEKPDFKIEGESRYPMKSSGKIYSIRKAFRAGCEHVWNTHVVPLQDQVRDLETANDNQRRTITVQAEGIRNTGYIFSRICADNGEHSHWTAIRMSDGAKVWSECPEECKAMGHAVEASEEFERLESDIKALREENTKCKELSWEAANEISRLKKEIDRLKAELKNANSALDNISNMGHA